ncbi:hypothetical protein ACP70R_009521 [Stipagrostis hirtigluma subsp. patula]
MWRARPCLRQVLPLLLCLYLVIAEQCLERPATRRRHAGRAVEGRIKTVVVIMMENRSFDHMLGWLRPSCPDIDGLTGREFNRLNASNPVSPEVFVSAHAAYGPPMATADGNDPAPMSGFVQQTCREGLGMARTVMSGFLPESVPVYSALAAEFAVLDRWFASVPTSTQPNRVFLHSATSHGLSSNVRESLARGLPQRTIFDSLDADGLDFGVYYQDIPAVLFLRRMRRLRHPRRFHSYGGAFRRHARRGTLPSYCVIEQHYFDSDDGCPANDDHPSHDVSEGQRLIKEVYETLRASPQWNETALVITYDEHGGFYDHVPTRCAASPAPTASSVRGTVVHEPDGPTPTSQYEHSSVPATVKKLFNLSSGFLTRRDSWAGTFDHLFTARDAPRTDYPEKLPEVKKTLRPFGPAIGARKPLSGFQEELIQLASELTGEHLSGSFADAVRGMTAGDAKRYARHAAARFLHAGREALLAGADSSAFVEMRNGIARTLDSVWYYLTSSE